MRKPARHRREELSDRIRSEIPIATTYQIYASSESDEQLNIFEKTLQNLKSFLWFLTKLDWTQFLHFMNDACLKPIRNEKLKSKADFPMPHPIDNNDFSETTFVKASDVTNKKRRFRRNKAS